MKNIIKKIALTIAMLFCFTAFSTQIIAEEGSIRLTNKAFKQVITTNEKGEKKLDYVEPKLATPGDVIFYSTTFENISKEAAADIVINNAIPNNSKYRAASAKGKDTEIIFSIDGGKSFYSPEKLIVKDKSGKSWVARPEDYTNIRWIYKKELAPGKTGTVSFKTMIR